MGLRFNNRQLFIATLLIAVVLSLLSLFNVSSIEQADANAQPQRVQGADIDCYLKETNPSVECSGEYYRGWPLNVGFGEFAVLDSGSLASQFMLRGDYFIYNLALWWGVLFSATQIEKYRRRT